MRAPALLLVAAIVLAATAWATTGSVAPEPTRRTAARAAPRPAKPPRGPRRRAAPPSDAQAAAAVLPAAVPLAAPAAVERTVRVVASDGAPLEGVTVAVGETVRQPTDARGSATFRVPDGVVAEAAVELGPRWRAVRLVDGLTEVVVDVPTLRIDGVDAATGRLVVPERIEVAARLDGVTVRREVQGESVALAIGAEADLEVAFVPPPGFAAAARLRWRRPVDARSGRLRVVVPVWPTTRRVLRTVDEQGVPTSGATLERATLLRHVAAEAVGETSPVTCAADGDRVVVEGLPAFPANAFRVVLSHSAEVYRDGSAVLRDLARPEPAALDVVLLPSGAFGGRCGGSRTLRGGCGHAAPTTGVPVRVRVLRADGSPARGVGVRVGGDSGVTSADGEVEIAVHARGRRVAVAAAHGFRAATAAVEVREGAALTLVEAPSRRVRVQVVDDAGEPVPGACVFAEARRVVGPDGAEVAVADATYAQSDGGVETLTPRTDPRGEILLDVSDALVRYDVTMAGAWTRVESADGDVLVTLPTPR